MTLFVFSSVIFAAILHAGWNAIIKFSDDKTIGMFVMSTSQGVMGLAMAVFLPVPRLEVWIWLGVSTLFHSTYKVFLTLAYERGDLSRVYPIARGTAPMLVVLAGILLLPDIVTMREFSGIFLVGCGILLMARGVFVHGESRRLIPFALASAAMTASYSMVDGTGARLAGDATVFVAWAFTLDGILFGSWALVQHGARVISASPKVWALGVGAGGASFIAYWIVVAAMTTAPIALVSGLRETSVLFAVVIGVLFFRERMDKGKIIASILIVAGVMLTRL